MFKEPVSIHQTQEVFETETLKQPLLFSCELRHQAVQDYL
jgi:hypothetical protein